VLVYCAAVISCLLQPLLHVCADLQESLPVFMQLRLRLDAAVVAWQRSEARRFNRTQRVLDELGIPREGYPEDQHGRSMRSSANRAIEKHGTGVPARDSARKGRGGRGRGGRGRRGG
jgi:hypothetical protein